MNQSLSEVPMRSVGRCADLCVMKWLNDCRRSQADIGPCTCFAAFQTAWSRSMALRMVSSLRMQATMATFLGLPAAIKRLWKTLMTGHVRRHGRGPRAPGGRGRCAGGGAVAQSAFLGQGGDWRRRRSLRCRRPTSPVSLRSQTCSQSSPCCAASEAPRAAHPEDCFLSRKTPWIKPPTRR